MKNELSKQEIELLEGVLFDAIIKAEIDTPERNEMENLKYKLWKAREGITYEHSTKKPTKALETQKEKAAAEVA